MRKLQDIDIKYRQDQHHKQQDHVKLLQDLQYLSQQLKKMNIESDTLVKEYGQKEVQLQM